MADEIKLKAPTVEQQVVVNINGEDKLKSFADTLDKISNNKNLQKYWKTQQDLINATADAYSNFQRKASKDNASELIKVTNALKAMSGTDLSNILPDFDKISKSMIKAQKIAGDIDSAFSVKGFKEAFDSFETLKAYGTDIQKLFSHFGVNSDIGELQQNVRLLEGEVEKLTRKLINARNTNEELRNEFENFKVGSGFADKLDELDRLKAEMQNIRDEATQTFNQFLDANKIDRYDWFNDDRFAEYFEKLENGTFTASEAIRQFKTEYDYLLEESFKSNGNSFGLDQLQAFSTKLDSIFHQVEETSNKINDILSNGVIAKSVQNLSKDTALSDAQRSIFGNILQDEESLKSITALFQKLIDETNQTKNTEVFNTEQFTKIESLFTSIESSLSSIKGVLVDVGDGEELSPLLKTINNIEVAVTKLSSSVKGVGINMNIDFGSDKEMEARAESKISNALQAYQRLFEHIKMSGAGSSIINTKFFDFDINQYDTAMSKLQAYRKFIENMRNEAKAMYGGQDVLFADTDKKYWTQASSAMGQVTKTFNEMKAASDTNPLENIFGKTNLTEVLNQLSAIVSKLDEISMSANRFADVFKNGLNVNASVEEIEKLTSRVKELESELAKIKTPIGATPQESNISSAFNSTVEQQIKSESELNAEIEKRENIIRELQQLQEKLTVHEDFHGNDRYFADQLPTEEEIREADKRIKQLTGINNIFNVDKLIQDRNEWLSEVKYSLEEYDDLIKANDQKALDEYTTRGLSRIGGAESFFGYEDNNFSIASKFVEEKEKIQNEINDLYTDLDKLDEKMNLDSNNSSVDNTVQSQEKLQSELKETQKQAEKTAQAVKESTTTASTEQKKDAFPNADTKLDEAVTSAKDLDKTLEQVDIPTDSFDKVLEKLDRTKSELVDIVKITKQSVSDADGKFHDSYTLKDSRGSTEIYGVNSKTDKGQILRQNIVGYDKKKDELDISKAQLEVDKQLAKEEDNLAKAQQKKAQAFLKEQTNYEEDQKKAELIKRQTLAYEELTDTISKYSEVAKRVAGRNAEDGDLELMTKLEDKISQLQKQPILSDSQVSKSEKSLVSLYDQLDKIERKLVETNQKSQDKQIAGFDKRLESYTKKTSGYDATIARFNDGGWTSDAYLENVQAVKNAVHEYETLLNELKGKDASLVTSEDISKLDEYEKKIKNTIATVTNMSAAEKGYNFVSGQKELDKIHKLLAENSKMSSEAKAKIKAYYAEIESGNPSMSLDKIHGEILKIYNAEVEAGRAGRTLWDTLKNSGFHQIAAQMAGMIGVYDVINVVKEGINTVRELDTAMTEVRKVSDATEAQYASFRDTVSSTAKEIASTNKELLNSSADFLRLGYSLEQAEDLAKNATLFVNVGDGVDITEATEDMITAMKAFDIKAEDSIKIVDDYNQIGNKYALSATDIGEAMKRSASALEVGNNSFEESIGLITAMNEIVQNSENTGNSLKVLSLRLRGAKAELEDMGEDTDGLCDSTSKLREQVKALSGVDIMEDDNTFKSTAQQVKELGEAFVKLDDVSQAALLEIIAGKSRSNAIAALLKNYQQIDNVIADLDDAEGSALRENEAIVDSIDGRIKVLSATAEEFWQKFIDTDFVKNAVSLVSDLLGLLTQIIDKFGTLPTIATGVAAALSFKNVGECNYIS